MGPTSDVAVKATSKEYRALVHAPSGAELDEKGEGIWPADQFTYRLRDEGAIRIVAAEDTDDAVAKGAAAAKKG